jgi:Na+/proline symporter
LALLAYLGGFSSATSMVILAAIATSTMVSNHIVMPISLWFSASSRAVSGDLRRLLLISRRISIAAILGLGFLYFRLSGGSDALAAIGLIAFVGVAQFLPSLLGGLFWRGATRAGAITGLLIGFILWAYTLFLPSFGGDFILSAAAIEHGPWGIAALRPQLLLGLSSLDPLVHAVVFRAGVAGHGSRGVAFADSAVFQPSGPWRFRRRAGGLGATEPNSGRPDRAGIPV